jgi:hypothetical protein
MTQSEPQRVAVGEALPGVEIFPLPPGETPVAAFLLIKSVDADGDESWWTRATETFDDHEILGALISYTDKMRAEQAAQWGGGDEAPEES